MAIIADKSKKNMEDLSTEELHEQIENDKKQAKRSTVFAMTALIAIIILCIAWFVANNRVSGTGSSISGQSDRPFELASVGNVRQDGDKLQLANGQDRRVDKYYDLETGKEVDTAQTYHVGTADLAWYANRQNTMSPGANGKLEFYIIPTRTGAGRTEAEVTIDLDAYQVSKVSDGKVEKSANGTLQNLVDGHILFFEKLNNAQGYSKWLYKDGVNKMTVNAPEGGFKEGVPYKVSVYWIWPKYFRNYVYNSRNAYGDLFADITNNEDYTKLIGYVNAHKSNLFGTNTIADSINNDMSDDVLDNCSKYYDEADEYIGRSKCYISMDASVQ